MMRREKRMVKIDKEFDEAVEKRNIIIGILGRSAATLDEVCAKITSGDIEEATTEHFLALSSAQLKDIIHARKFTGSKFRESLLPHGPDGKLNKTVYRSQTAESIRLTCNLTNPCLVWLAWQLRSETTVLEVPPEPERNCALLLPKFTIMYAGPETEKTASQYLLNDEWVNDAKATLLGRSTTVGVTINDELLRKADALASAMISRLTCYIGDRVPHSRQKHWVLPFVRDNIHPVAATMCLFGHIVDELETYGIKECLLQSPTDDMFQLALGELGKLEGNYLYYDKKKRKWIRSGKTSGQGVDACFEGRGNKHEKNAASLDMMRLCQFYAKFPLEGAENLGARKGYFDNLVMYCSMAYDKTKNVEPLISSDKNKNLLVWSKQSLAGLKKKKGDLQQNQLDAVSYLWELCYDLLLASGDNISESPGFESFGLREVENNKKRTRDDMED